MNHAKRNINKVIVIIALAALVAFAVTVLPGTTWAVPAGKTVTLQNPRPDLGASRQVEVGQSKSYQVSYLSQALSTNPAIATVKYTAGADNNNGLVTFTGVKAGLASLIYGNNVGAITAIEYLITDPDNVSSYTLKDGGEMYFSAVPGSPGQRETRPSPVTVTAGQFSRISWSSMNESVATVSANGAVTSVGEGATIVTGDFIDKWGVPGYINILVCVGGKPGGDPGQPVTSILIYPPGMLTYVPQLNAGETMKFSAGTEDAGTVLHDVAWEVSGNKSAGTTISSDGLLTVASDESVEYVTIRATYMADPSVFKNQYVKILYPSPGTVTSIMIYPPGMLTYVPQLDAGETMKFSAEVKGTGTVPQGVTWEVFGNKSAGTTISSDGLLTVAQDESVNSIGVRATSKADPGVYKNQGIIIMYPLTGIDVEPSGPVEVSPGKSLKFVATLQSTGTDAKTLVQWRVLNSQSSDTKIDYTGLLQIGSDEPEGELTVRASYCYPVVLDPPVFVDVTVRVK